MPTLTGDLGNNTLIAADASDHDIYGLAGSDRLVGNDGDDHLDGGIGADDMEGGDGDDTYVVDNTGDTVSENFLSGISRTLEAEVGNGAALAGVLEVNLTGNASANRLDGNGATNVLNGAGGVDDLWGYGGDDDYCVDIAGDTVHESSGQGTDSVHSRAAIYTLPAYVENLYLEQDFLALASGIDGTGNGLANVIDGNTVDNVLRGQGGNDTLFGGGGGGDTLEGGSRQRCAARRHRHRHPARERCGWRRRWRAGPLRVRHAARRRCRGFAELRRDRDAGVPDRRRSGGRPDPAGEQHLHRAALDHRLSSGHVARHRLHRGRRRHGQCHDGFGGHLQRHHDRAALVQPHRPRGGRQRDVRGGDHGRPERLGHAVGRRVLAG